MNAKTEQAHTPGVLELWTSNSFRRFGIRGGAPICEPITQRSDGHPDLYFRNGGPDGPDARRFLACWNACNGISTKALETPRGMAGAIEPVIAECHALRQQRDQLAQVLQRLQTAVHSYRASGKPNFIELMDADDDAIALLSSLNPEQKKGEAK